MNKHLWILVALSALAAALLTLGVAAAEHKLTLVNLDWDKVAVEAREGDEASCADRPFLGQRILSKGEAWSNLPCGRPCWRKKLPGYDWGPWISTSCFSKSETYEIN